MLRKRLEMVSKMVREGVIAADIGTDHAYLPIFLVEKGICPSALAADVVPGPLKNAQKNIALHRLEDKISTRLSDGLDELRPNDADDFIFAGMGGTLIVELLERTDWIKDRSKRFIFQPMSHGEDVRKFLCENGFEIICEDACTDSGRIYIALCAEYTGVITKPPVSFYYTGRLSECENDEAKLYLARQTERLRKAIDALEKSGGSDPELRLAVDQMMKI